MFVCVNCTYVPSNLFYFHITCIYIMYVHFLFIYIYTYTHTLILIYIYIYACNRVVPTRVHTVTQLGRRQETTRRVQQQKRVKNTLRVRAL